MADKPKRCFVCEGRGYTRCACWPGDCICGFGDETCAECNGDGVDPDDYGQSCDHCNDTGKADCMSCGGDGEVDDGIECLICEGTGTVICECAEDEE